MTRDEATDPILRMLARLPSIEPGAASVDLVRARCHAALARGEQQRARLHGGQLSTRILNVAVFAALGIYLADAVRQAVRLIS